MTKLSILISNYKRLNYLKKVLNYIRINIPDIRTIETEIICADEKSEETPQILELFKSFSPYLKYKVIVYDQSKVDTILGSPKQFNSPVLSNNLARYYATGQYLILHGNDTIGLDDCYNKLVHDFNSLGTERGIVFSTTYDCPKYVVDNMGEFGEKFNDRAMQQCYPFCLQRHDLKTMVTNYASITTPTTWDEIGGYDIRYIFAISSEDSDFVRRARKLSGYKEKWSSAKTIHMWHGGKTHFYDPDPNVIAMSKWNTLVRENHVIYDMWDGSAKIEPLITMDKVPIEQIITNI
jgi:GT2 family glycosyltransferase